MSATMTQQDAIAEIRTDIADLKTILQQKDDLIGTLTSDKAALVQQIADLNAKASTADSVSPDLSAAISDLHAFAISTTVPAAPAVSSEATVGQDEATAAQSTVTAAPSPGAVSDAAQNPTIQTAA